MTEMIWCKRERILIKTLEAVFKFGGIIVGLAAIAFSLWFMGMIISGEQINFGMQFFGGFIALTTTIMVPATVAMVTYPTKTIRLAMPLFAVSLVLGALGSFATFRLGMPIGAICSATFAFYAVATYIHIGCMSEYYAKLVEQLGHEPSYLEAAQYIKKTKEVRS
jgi:hypothetical protein